MSQPILMQYQDLPFNGDFHIGSEFLKLKDQYELNVAIETGSCFYVTTKFLAQHFEKVFTCEINEEYAKWGREGLPNNVEAVIMDSVQYLTTTLKNQIKPEDRAIYFLDAHWLNHCPLIDEIKAIGDIKTDRPPVIAIHDFKTDNPEHGFDSYFGIDFDLNFISASMEILENKLGVTYSHYFNTESAGANRGIIYLTPNN